MEGFHTVDTEVASVHLLDPSPESQDQCTAGVEGRKSDRSKEDEGCTVVAGIDKGSGNTRRVNEVRIEMNVGAEGEENRIVGKGSASTMEKSEVEAFLLLESMREMRNLRHHRRKSSIAPFVEKRSRRQCCSKR